jgi:hypothetical protein
MKITPSSRKHCCAARIGVLLVTAVLIAGVGGAYYVGGDNNTPAQNLEIRTWYDLDAIRDNLSGNHTLMNDLDSNTLGYEELASPTANQGKGWEPVGFFGTSPLPDVGCSGAVPPPAVWCFGLTGTFDGQGYEIRDLYIDRPDDCYKCPIGLFTCIDEGGIIKNVGVVNITMTGCGAVGGLVGENWHGTVSNSYSTGSVSGNENVGGLVGLNRRTISNSYSTGSVTGDMNVGGLVGENFGNVNDSYSTGSVTGAKYIGGLVGRTISNLTNCYATGSVTGNDNVGGLIGYNGGGSSIVNNSYSTGSVSGNENVGGLVGEGSYDNVTNSFWDTEISGQATSAGGIGKTTEEMQDITTFSGVGWNITAVANTGIRNPSYAWNIVNGMTYPFLSWQP